MHYQIVERSDGWWVLGAAIEAGPYPTNHTARTVRSEVRANGWDNIKAARAYPSWYVNVTPERKT